MQMNSTSCQTDSQHFCETFKQLDVCSWLSGTFLFILLTSVTMSLSIFFSVSLLTPTGHPSHFPMMAGLHTHNYPEALLISVFLILFSLAGSLLFFFFFKFLSSQGKAKNTFTVGRGSSRDASCAIHEHIYLCAQM